MDEGDEDVKSNIEGGFEADLRCQDPSLIPLPVLIGRREICNRFQRYTNQQLEHWSEESLVQSKHSQLNCQLPGTPKSTFLMVFSPDGTKVASTHGDHNIYVTDVKTGKCICTLKGHPRTPWSVAFHPSSNEIIASGCLDGQVRVWDLKGGSEVWTPEKKHVIASLAFHPTDQVLVIATDNELYFWDWFCPEPFAKISTGSEREKVKYVKFDPLGYKLITGIANVRHVHRHEVNQTNCGTNNNSGSTTNSRNSTCPTSNGNQTFQSGWTNSATRYMERYRSRLSTLNSLNSDMAEQEASSQAAGNSADFSTSQRTDPHRARNFARIIRELNDRTRTQELARANGSVAPSDSSSSENVWRPYFRNSSYRGSRDASVPFEEDLRLGELRHPIRPVSDDSGSSSSLDSSSSVASSLSGTSHERNTRLSLLWTSRLNRAGNETDNNAVAGYDLEERRGEGTVMRGETSSSSELPSNIPLPDSESVPLLADNDEDSDGESDTRGGSGSSTGGRIGGQGGRWMYYRGKFPWNIPHPRLRNGNLGTGATDSLSELNRPAPMRNSSRQLRSFNFGRQLLMAPGPSGISQRIPSASEAQPVSDSLDQSSSSRPQNSSLLDPHFGVQLLSRHIENMQRICRSLSLPRAHLELTRHRHEITRLQQIRSMLYDIQHQIRELRASVDQSISEEFSDVIQDESLNSINSTSPTSESISAELLNSSSVTDQVELEVDIQDDLNQYSYSTLAEEDPDQLEPALIPRLVPPPSHAYDNTGASNSATRVIPDLRNLSARILRSTRSAASLSRARLLARLQRPSAPSSRVRSRNCSRNRLVWPWLIRRLPHRRRPTRSRLHLSTNTNNLASNGVVTRTSVGINRNRSARLLSADARETRCSRRGLNPTQRVDVSSRLSRRIPTAHAASVSGGVIVNQVRRRHSGDWQRRLRSLVAADPATESFELPVPATSNIEMEDSALLSDGTMNPPLNNSASDRHIGITTDANSSFSSDALFSLIDDLNSISRPQAVASSSTANAEAPAQLSGPSAIEQSERSLLEIQAEVNHLSDVILNNTRPLLSPPPQSFYSESGLSLDNQVLPSQLINNFSISPNQESSLTDNFNEAMDVLDANASASTPLLSSDQPLTPTHYDFSNNDNSNLNNTADSNSSEDEDSEMPEGVVRAGPPTTSLSSRIAAMLSQQEAATMPSVLNSAPSQAESTRDNNAVIESGGSARSVAEVGSRSRLRDSRSYLRYGRLNLTNWPYSTGFHSPPPSNPFFEEEDFLLRNRESPDDVSTDADDRPFLQSLRSLRREIMISHRNRMLRRSSLVSGGDLAGATLAAINSNFPCTRDVLREHLRIERRERYRQMLQMMADRLNRLMNRNVLSQHLRDNPRSAFLDENEAHLSPGQRSLRNHLRSGPATGGQLDGSTPSNGNVQENSSNQTANSSSAAIDSHMRNLRLLVRLALHLIYQLLNFICNQNISYEERPISRLPNPFREEEDNSLRPGLTDNDRLLSNSFDLDIEPGLHNLTTLLETVRMASEELRNDALTGSDHSAARSGSATTGFSQPSSSLPCGSTAASLQNSEEPVRRNAFLNDSQRQSSFSDAPGQSPFQATSTTAADNNTNNAERPSGSAVRRRLTDFLIRTGSYMNDLDYLGSNRRTQPEAALSSVGESNESHNPPSQQTPSSNRPPYRPSTPLRDFRVSPPPPLVIPQIILSDLSEERQSDGIPLLNPESLDNLASASSNALPNEEFSFHLRSFGGIPLRFLGRQNAVDRRSPDSEDSNASASQAGREENGSNGAGSSNDRSNNSNPSHSSIGRQPFRPWGLSSGGAIRPIPNLPSAESPFVDRGPERGDPDHFMYFSRPFFNQYMATRNISVSFYDPYSPLFAGATNPTHRIQAWDFIDSQIPDISDSFSNIVVQKCKIHFDASVSISEDGNMLAALIPENQPLTRVCVFSLERKTLGQVLYSSIMDSNTICVSISPTMRHLVVGFASYHTRLSVHHNEKQLVASIYKLCDNPQVKERHQAGTLLYLKAIELQRDHRLVSLNCIRWMPFPGQGLIYGTNRGQLTILR